MAVLLKRLLAFARDSRGVVGIMFGLTLVPMLGMIGLAVDYSVAVRVNSSLRAAADAAALAAARAYVDEAPDNPTASLINAAIERAKQRGANLFNSNVGPSAISPSVSIDLSVNGLKVTSTATYSGASPIYFNKIFGFRNVSLSGSATASLDTPIFQNFYVVIDNSQSMGIGATQDDMDALKDATQCQTNCYKNGKKIADEEMDTNCVFGCHAISDRQTGHVTQSNEDAASPLIKMRIDVVREATQKMLETTAAFSLADHFQYALYTMQFDDLTTVAPLSNNYTSLKSAASGIRLGSVDSDYLGGDSDLRLPLASLAQRLPQSGNGRSRATAKNYVFIMTDGVRDNLWPHDHDEGLDTPFCFWKHCVYPFDDSWCQGLKTKGATVIVLYTTYLPFPGEKRYDAWIAHDRQYNNGDGNNILDDSLSNLKSCASSGYFFQADYGPDIMTAVDKALAKAVLTPPRLTQ